MSLKKIIAISLSLALMLLCGMPTVLADGETETGPELPAVPQVTVTGVNVENTEYFELGVKVTAGSFQSVGLILGYDTKTLVPVNWQDGSAVNVSGSGWDAPTVLMTKGADGLSGKPGLAYYAAGEGGGNTYAYVYIGASALEYKELSDEQVVTLRFQRQADDSGALKTVTMGPSADQSKTIEFAPAAVAEASIPGYQAIAFTNADTFYTEGEEWHVAFGEVTDGPGIGTTTTPSGSSGDYAVTFFDWDGRVIDAIATDPATASGDVTAFTDRLKAQAGSPLTAKKGYDFYGWLLVREGENGLTTAHNTFVAAATAAEYTTGDAAADFADFTNLPALVSGALQETSAGAGDGSKSILVQAAYVENETCNTGLNGTTVTEGTKIYYTVSDPVYTRYGAANAKAGQLSGQYSITYTVRRENAADKGVTKLRQPAIYVTMKPSATDRAQDIVMKIDLTNTDETTFEVIPTRLITQVDVAVNDTYGFSSWPNSGKRSETTDCSKNTFILMGSWGFVRDQAIDTLNTLGGNYLDVNQWSPDWKTNADADTFKDGGLVTGTLDAVALEAAKVKILKAMEPLSAEQRRAVTQQDLKNMIAGTYTAPTT